MTYIVRSNAKYIVRGGNIYVRAFYNDGSFEKKIDYSPYFYTNAPIDFVKSIDHVIDVVNYGQVYHDKDVDIPVVCVYVDFPFNVPNVRRMIRKAGYSTFESDIRYILRLFIDGQLKLDVSMENVAYIDIEVDYRDGSMSEYGKSKILACSIVSDNGLSDGYFDIRDYNSEADMLWAVNTHLAEHKLSVLVGWNIDYDYNHLVERSKTLGVDAFALNVAMPIDLLRLYRRAVKGLPDYKLDTVLRYEGLGEKVRLNREIYELDRGEMFEYNFNDAFSLKLINDKYNFVDVYIVRMLKNNLPIDFLTPVVSAEANIFREIYTLGHVGRDRAKFEKSGYSGAVVIQPQVGLFKYVGYFDVNSMYPNIIRYENIDIDGYGGEIVPKIITDLLETRFKYKRLYKETGDVQYNIMQNAYKIDANSYYGIFGNIGFRWFNEEKAEKVTATGRNILMRMKKFLKDVFNLDVIYGDTDGIFVDLSSLITDDMSIDDMYDVANFITDAINKEISPYSVKVEAILRRMIFIKSSGNSKRASKKRYIGEFIDRDSFLVRGIELVRSNQCELVKIVQKMVIDMIFSDKTKDEIYEYLYDVRNRLRKGELDKLLIISTGVKEKIEDYDANQPHVRALRKAIEMGKRPTDLRIRYVYIKNRKILDVEPIFDISDLENLKTPIDYNYYWEHVIYPPVKKIIDSVFDKSRQLSIEKFIYNDDRGYNKKFDKG